MTIRIGISGWRYAPWRGEFYPDSLPQHRELWYASRCFNSIEINGTFYSLQRPEFFADWYEQTPDRFVFAVKGPRFITHMKKLRDPQTPLANFFASGVFNLREKLGPILWQLPPMLPFDEERLATFLKLLPRTTDAARRLARKHDHRLKGRASLSIDRNRRLRHALEIRHASYVDASFIALLRKHNVALVVADTADRFPRLGDVTSDYIYMRLHGDETLYQSGYSAAALQAWRRRIERWATGKATTDLPLASRQRPKPRVTRDVFCYFDNTDVKLRAPIDARSLMRLLAIESPPASRDAAYRAHANTSAATSQRSM
jgi:uncharacterized protein YecE (DUF72 family)